MKIYRLVFNENELYNGVEIKIKDSQHFNDAWPLKDWSHKFKAVAKEDGVNSREELKLAIYVTSLPLEGGEARVFKNMYNGDTFQRISLDSTEFKETKTEINFGSNGNYEQTLILFLNIKNLARLVMNKNYFINIKQEGLDLFNFDILLKPVNKETADNISRTFLINLMKD